jgi:hypothetical protein
LTAPDENGDLALLEAVLREDAPLPDPAFAEQLDRRVAEGFARERRFRLSFLPPRRVLALGTAAAALIVVVVAAIGLVNGSEKSSDQATVGEAESQPVPPRTTGTAPQPQALLAAPTGAAGGPTSGGTDDSATARRVERSAQMTIAAAAGDLAGVADQIGQVAEAHRGFVVSSHVATGDDSTRGGDFVLRVPTTEMEATLGELGKLGDVRARSETSQDMTAPYRHVQDRLGNLLLERRATADRLRSATGDEALRLRARMRELSAAIERASGHMHAIKHRTVFSTVNVTLEQKRDTGAGGAGGGPGGALHDALDTLGGALELAIRALGVLVPIALLAALAWLGAAVLKRRRREAALF